MSQADIGLIGLAVMGENLVLNMNDHGIIVAVFNRTVSKVDDFMQGPAKGTNVIPTHSIPELISKLKKPRRVMLMVKAGKPVDDFIDLLLPYLEPGDIIIDGGNSLFTDTNRRVKTLKEKGISFIGTGISGGEVGARTGPSIMPGGDPQAWPHVKDIFQSIAAKVNNGEPCCDWVGSDGAGHYVKMVHNGIEYGDMQLICEAYHLMKVVLQLNPQEMHEIFTEWNNEELNSYLIEITAKIFAAEEEDGTPLLENILDVAGQKGTGKWTVIDALDQGVPLTLISEAVFARCLSAMKEERVEASKLLKGPNTQFEINKSEFISSIMQALYASKIISYAQGFMLMRQASHEYNWNLNYGAVAMMWRGGCIIRSSFLGEIKTAFERDKDLKSLVLDSYFNRELDKAQQGWRKVVATSALMGVPTPCFSTALAFYDGYRSEKLPANLLQALRDFFGAHTYERIDKPRGQFFHTDWSGTGGKVSAGSYNV